MDLFYHEFGEGDNLIILHGLFGISDNWVGIGNNLSERYRVLIPDLRNHGRSFHSSVFNYPSMVEDLTEFFDAHIDGKAIVIGHSMGGKAAMNFALEYPEKVEKLIVVDISPEAYPYRQQHVHIIDAMKSVDFNVMKSRKDVDAHLKTLIKDERIRLFIMKNLYRLDRGRLDWRINLDAISLNLDSVFEGITHRSSYSGDCLFVRGGLSDYIIDEHIPAIMTLFPNAVIQTIEGATHWLHAEKPEELCSIFSEFLGRECKAR